MSVNLIAAIGKNGELGKYNKLIWNIPEDMNFFKKTTMGKYVVMGRKTFESLPSNLKGRTMIVVSSQNLDEWCDAICYHDVLDVLEYLKDEELYIIGGASIYEQFLPFADTMFLTEINDFDYEADAYFPYFDDKDWRLETIKESTTYSDIDYCRKKYVRKKVK